MRNRVVVITLLPVIIFLWIIGWSLFWIGSQNKPQKTEATTERDPISMTIVMCEEHKAKS
jgi:hypothetical protein